MDEVLDHLPLSDVIYLLSIRIEGLKAANLDYKINFVIAAVTVTMLKETLYKMATTNQKPDSSKITVEGDIQKWNAIIALLDKKKKAYTSANRGYKLLR